MKLYRLNDEQNTLPSTSRLVAETRGTLTRIEQVLANAEAWRQVHPADRLRNLAECADNVLSELVRTAITRTAR